MDIIDVILLSIGLSMDSFTVAIASGLIIKEHKSAVVFRMALLFALFQGLMPLLGYFSGYFFKDEIQAFDHWIALIILSFLGAKMIWDGIKSDEIDDDRNSAIKPHHISSLIMLSLATSIDAMATGILFVSFSWWFLLMTLTIIAFVTFIFAFSGNYVGAKYGHYLEFRVEIFGGLILIGIGVKILIEHMYFQ